MKGNYISTKDYKKLGKKIDEAKSRNDLDELTLVESKVQEYYELGKLSDEQYDALMERIA